MNKIAAVYAQIGDKDKALSFLERAYEKREAGVKDIKSSIYDPIRSEPRFQDLVRRIGLPQ